MKYKNIVNGPQNASRIILGCMRMPALSVEDAAKMIKTASELGVNFFDHATCYGADEAEVIELGGVATRDRQLLGSGVDDARNAGDDAVGRSVQFAADDLGDLARADGHAVALPERQRRGGAHHRAAFQLCHAHALRAKINADIPMHSQDLHTLTNNIIA